MPKNICAGVKEGDLKTVKKLLKAGADIDIRCTKEGDISDLKENQKTLLHLAIENCDRKMIAFIAHYYCQKVDYKKLLSALDENAHTVLRLAIEKQRKAVDAITQEIYAVARVKMFLADKIPGESESENLTSLQRYMSDGLFLAIEKKDYKLFHYFLKIIEDNYLVVVPPSPLNVTDFNSDDDDIEEYFKDGLMQLGAYDPDPESRKSQKALNEGNLGLAEKIKKQKEEADRIKIKRDKRIEKARKNRILRYKHKLDTIDQSLIFGFVFILEAFLLMD